MKLSAARVFVRDLVAADLFYSETLGLSLQAGSPAIGFCVYNANGCQLVVESVAQDAPTEEQVLVGRFTGLSFEVNDVRAKHRELVAQGVQFTGEPEPQSWGGILATLLDPAGNELQLVQHPSAA